MHGGHIKNQVALTCDICGRGFTRRAGNVQRTAKRQCCSVACRAEAHREPLEDRFWKYANPTPEGCWLWTGQKALTGYGVLGENGKNQLAHRISYRLHHGPIPDHKHVLHRCDTPACVRPDHLFIGDARANGRDMSQKGRTGGAKLTPGQARLARRLFALGNVTKRSLAKKFGVHESTMGMLLNRKTFVDL